MITRFWIVSPVFVLLLLSGCGGAKKTPVGTRGSLRDLTGPLAEVQITVHREEAGAWSAVGLAESDASGDFGLVTPGATGPVVLAAGEYRCTLESVGAPVKIPPAYLKPETSPLRVSHASESARLDVSLPLPRVLIPYRARP